MNKRNIPIQHARPAMIHRLPLTRLPRSLPRRLLHISLPPRAARPKARPKTTKKRLADLPTHAVVDGVRAPALDAWRENVHVLESACDDGVGEDAAYERAVEEGTFPRTPLAREIFRNLRRYEGDILLTRVGMFYEVSHAPSQRLLGLMRRGSHISHRLQKSRGSWGSG